MSILSIYNAHMREKWKRQNKLYVTTYTKKYCYLCTLVLSQLLIDWCQEEDWLII